MLWESSLIFHNFLVHLDLVFFVKLQGKFTTGRIRPPPKTWTISRRPEKIHPGKLRWNLKIIPKWIKANQLNRTFIWVVVSNLFCFHPHLGKIPILTNIFQMDWNHQLASFWGNQNVSFWVVYLVCQLQFLPSWSIGLQTVTDPRIFRKSDSKLPSMTRQCLSSWLAGLLSSSTYPESAVYVVYSHDWWFFLDGLWFPALLSSR